MVDEEDDEKPVVLAKLVALKNGEALLANRRVKPQYRKKPIHFLTAEDLISLRKNHLPSILAHVDNYAHEHANPQERLECSYCNYKDFKYLDALHNKPNYFPGPWPVLFKEKANSGSNLYASAHDDDNNAAKEESAPVPWLQADQIVDLTTPGKRVPPNRSDIVHPGGHLFVGRSASQIRDLYAQQRQQQQQHQQYRKRNAEGPLATSTQLTQGFADKTSNFGEGGESLPSESPVPHYPPHPISNKLTSERSEFFDHNFSDDGEINPVTKPTSPSPSLAPPLNIDENAQEANPSAFVAVTPGSANRSADGEVGLAPNEPKRCRRDATFDEGRSGDAVNMQHPPPTPLIETPGSVHASRVAPYRRFKAQLVQQHLRHGGVGVGVKLPRNKIADDYDEEAEFGMVDSQGEAMCYAQQSDSLIL